MGSKAGGSSAAKHHVDLNQNPRIAHVKNPIGAKENPKEMKSGLSLNREHARAAWMLLLPL